MLATSGKSLVVYLCLYLNFPMAQQSQSKIHIKNISYLGPQLSPQLSRLSRDGGASVLLNGHVVWLFDDTEVTSNDDELLIFVSNTAAYSHAPKSNLTLLDDFGISASGKQSLSQRKHALGADKSLSDGGWIPFAEDELAFNRQDPGNERVAIWPGTNPAPLNPVSAILYAPVVYVEATNKTDAKQYKAHGVTLITIRAGHAGPTASRAVDILFSTEDVPYGVFIAIVGLGSDKFSLDVYLFGIANSGLQLARVKSTAMKNLKAYEYFEPASCSFTSTSPNPMNANLSSIYLAGNYSSGSIFYSPFLKTYLMVYFNDQADSTFYIRYLDLESLVCPTKAWVKGGKYGKGIEAEDVEAVIRYGWSSEAVLYRSPPGPKGFNYAGLAHPEFFNNQYYARCMYWYQGIDSDMESGWIGGGLLEQEQAGVDGRHLLLSWTSQEEGLNGHGRYQVMLAKVELDHATIHARPSHTSNSTTPSASHGGKVNAGSSVCHSRIWSGWWQFPRSASILLAFARLAFGLFC